MLASLFVACTPADKPEETPGESTPSSPSAESTPSDNPDESDPEESGMYNSVTALPENLDFGGKEIQFISREFGIYNDELTV